MDETLSDQLSDVVLPKLRHLVVTGENLVNLEVGALSALEDCRELVIEISGTQVQDIPNGFFAGLTQNGHLSINLRDNRLVSLSPAAFYSNATSWEHVGTKLIAGGLLLDDNPWVCDCGLVWVGHWLRRWLRESLQLHTAPADAAQSLALAARAATCSDPRSGRRTPLLALRADDLSCHASALSRATCRQRHAIALLAALLLYGALS